MSTAVVIVDDGSHILFMNASAETLFGISRNQAVDQQLGSLVPGLDELSPLINRALREDHSFGCDLTLTLPQRDQVTIELASRIAPVGDAGAQAIVEFFDATKLRQFDREQALISQRGVSRRIVRQLAHEIRNPLGGLRGAAQLLERKLVSPEQREYTQVIIREADRLKSLTDGLLGPTRVPEILSVNVHELLEHVLLLIESDTPEDIAIIRDYDPSLPNINADRDQIIQAFLNLSRNALQALGQSGRLIIRTRALTNFVIGTNLRRLTASIEFEDDGPGISAEIADSIFYPLVTDRDGGTGLGLPLAQDCVRRHGGLIEAESVPGRTVFMVRLPLAESDVDDNA